MKFSKFSFKLLFLICFTACYIHAWSNDYVELKNFRETIFHETISSFIISSSNSEFSLSSTAFQQVIEERKRKNRKIIFIKTGPANIPKQNERDNHDKYLIDTRFLNLDNPQIREISLKFKKSNNVIYDVEKYVFTFITDKTLGIPLMPVKNIIESRAGDCTEHSVLAISILRKLGIPARAVVGMVFSREFLGKKNVFVFHMWVEAFNGNKWVLVDPSQPFQKRLNHYVAFAYHDLKTEMPLSYMRAISAIQELEIEYIKD